MGTATIEVSGPDRVVGCGAARRVADTPGAAGILGAATTILICEGTQLGLSTVDRGQLEIVFPAGRNATERGNPR